MDEPMASQGHDSEAPLTHNTSKSNFFNMTAEGAGGGGGGQPDVSVVSRGGRGETPVGAKYRSVSRLCAKSAVFSVFNHNENVSLFFPL